MLGDVAGMDVLEFGCGGGQWSISLARLGARPVGLDLSIRQLSHALRLMEGASERFPLVNANAERTPFADERFDLVFCDHGAMSFADPYLTVPEVARVLRPGGRFAFNIASPLIWLCWGDGEEPPGSGARPQLLRPAPRDLGLGRVPAAVRGLDPAVPIERVRGPRPDRAPAAGPPADHVSGFRAPRAGLADGPARTSGSSGSSDEHGRDGAARGTRAPGDADGAWPSVSPSRPWRGASRPCHGSVARRIRDRT